MVFVERHLSDLSCSTPYATAREQGNASGINASYIIGAHRKRQDAAAWTTYDSEPLAALLAL